MKIIPFPRPIDGAATTLVIAMTGRNIVGTVEIRIGKHAARIRALFVAPSARRIGVATELLERCYRLAREAGCESVGLIVWRSNETAITLYRRHGFFVVNEDEREFELVRHLG